MAEHRTVQKDILPRGQVQVKARAQLDQGRDLAVDGHADVYKRQGRGPRAEGRGLQGQLCPHGGQHRKTVRCYDPVSYTHLDVYKRQPYNRQKAVGGGVLDAPRRGQDPSLQTNLKGVRRACLLYTSCKHGAILL